VTRISWSDPSLSGGLFEKIVACLLGIENPDAIRIRTSQGDAGVDILAPVDDETIDVYQLKHYPHRMHWTKVKESLARLSSGQWMGWTIRNWHLVVPKQPTKENLAKLRELSKDVPFKAKWFGEDKLVPLAAAHPEVEEYYLGDGRARLQHLVEDWDNSLSRIAAGNAPRIEDVQERLSEMATALGGTDPHFRYGLEVHPATSGRYIVVRPDAIAASSREFGGHIITCHTYPRYRGAVEDAADRMGGRLQLTPSAAARLAEVIAVGGAPLLFTPEDVVALELPRVGHQPPPDAQWFARITPIVDVTPEALRLVVKAMDGEQLVTRLTRTGLTTGTDGATAIWTSPGRCVEVTTVARAEPQHISVSIQPSDRLNGPISDVVDDLPLLRAVQPGASIAIGGPVGPIDPDAPSVEIARGIVSREAVAMLDALRVIQDHTRTVITVPEELTTKELADVIETAALLEGLPTTGDMLRETLTVTWPVDALGPGGAQDLFSENFALGVSLDCGRELSLPHQSVHLTEDLCFVRLLRTATVGTVHEDEQDGDPVVRVSFAPGPIPIWIDQRIGDPSEFTDELQQRLCEHDAPISVESLSAELSSRGSRPTRS
jgi:hypothetical protein